MNGVLNISSAPHTRDRWTTPYIMRMVLLSLMPATIVGILVNGWNAFGIVALAVVSAVASNGCSTRSAGSRIPSGTEARP